MLKRLNYAIIKKTDHEDICAGKLNLSECILDKSVDFDGAITYKLMTPQLENEFNFQNTLLVWITEPVVTDTEFTIEWNKWDRQWIFGISDIGRKILEGPMYDSTLVFFVMLETDFDFLIRASISNRILCVQKPLLFARIHKKNFSLTRRDLHISELKNWLKYNYKLLENIGVSLRDQKFYLFKLELKKIINFFLK